METDVKTELEPVPRTQIFILRTTIGQEYSVGNLIARRVKIKGDIDLKSILVPETLRGYVFIEVRNRRDVDLAIAGIPHVRTKIVGNVPFDEIKNLLIRKSPLLELEPGGIVEIILGPFKGSRAKITRIDSAHEELTVQLLDSGMLATPIPISLHADHVRLVERAKKKDEEKEEEEEEGEE